MVSKKISKKAEMEGLARILFWVVIAIVLVAAIGLLYKKLISGA